MQIAIVQFPGSECERETMLAVKRAGMEPVEFLWNDSKEKLATFDGYIIVGGFSHEDRSRVSVVAAYDPIIDVIKQQGELGKPILGISNGAQILVEAGLVPGVENNVLTLALTDNKRIQQDQTLETGYYNALVCMRLSDKYQYNAFTRCLTTSNILRVPVAHAEGRFVIPPALLAEMQENGLNVFQYCDERGKVVDEFPVNPNGSVNNIAAISNKAGNIMAMMPHPERTMQGDAIFQSMRDYIEQGYKQKVAPLLYYPRSASIQKYQSSMENPSLFKGELISVLPNKDQQDASIEAMLNRNNITVKISRYVHWDVLCDSESTFEKIKMSGMLFNDNKEPLIDPQKLKSSKSAVFLVRAKEDLLGQQKLQAVKNHFAIGGVESIQYSIIWQIEGSEDNIHQLLHSHILYNPYAYDCYEY